MRRRKRSSLSFLGDPLLSSVAKVAADLRTAPYKTRSPRPPRLLRFRLGNNPMIKSIPLGLVDRKDPDKSS